MTQKSRTLRRARVLRRAMTLPEVLLWQRLRGEQIGGLRFRRQHPVGPFTLDFYCAEARLAVEIDGASHDLPDQVRHDARRTAWLQEQKIETLRVLAQDILARDGMQDVLATISAVSGPSTALRAVPLPGSAGEDQVRGRERIA